MLEDLSRYTVLNVNDNERGRYVVSRMLKNAGFQVLEAATGLGALNVAIRHQPDAVVLDVRLPDLNGYEVCRRLKSDPATSAIGVLHTSATFVTAEKKVQGLEVGADGYLTQPFESEELIALLRSVLRLKHAENELRARAERLAEADRRKDEFLAMLAHELRNPLAAISTSLPLLEQLEARTETERRVRDVIARQTNHLSRLVDDLLDVSRVTRGRIDLKKDEVNLGALLRRVFLAAEDRFANARQQTFSLSLCDEAQTFLRGDATRLEQIFTNLLDNASKYTDPGGEVRLVAEVEPVLGRAGWIRVCVSDTGVGIAPEALSSIFALFSQANVSLARSRGGLGIGLTLVRTLVELHGGHVVGRSPGLGKGSEFEVRLPLISVATPQPKPPARPSGAPRVRRRVLIVEDNSDARQSLSDLCELWGHEVVVASDGLTGVQRILEEQPDVALVDIGLPGIDGYEVARQVRADPRGREVELVALTGYGSPEQRELALRHGFDLHLVKPVETERLRLLLAKLVGPQAISA